MTKQYQLPKGVQIVGEMRPGFEHVLTYDALELLAILHRKFDHTRLSLLQKRLERQQAIDRGDLPDFLPETREVREGDWQVGNIPDDLQFRRVEITGPVERKMMINALNSGAQVFMADCEDANSPTWDNIIEGQINLKDAVNGTISFASPDGKKYALKEKVAVLLVRPRGWHLPEKHIEIDGEKVSGGLVDFTLYFYHNARNLLKKGTGPYFYLPKLESYLEARLWNDVFNLAQDHLAIPRGTIKVTVLVETILAAYQMEEILYELRDHIVGMNAGRWDYIFSTIKRFRKLPGFLLPDRGQITMTVPFMRA
nr:malate synthase A [Calditrichia bacterium]